MAMRPATFCFGKSRTRNKRGLRLAFVDILSEYYCSLQSDFYFPWGHMLARILFSASNASLFVAWTIAFIVDAHALEIWRNQQRYDIEVRLPKGASFQHQGVDRTFSSNGISGNLRLIQDNYENCTQLIDERRVNRAKDGFTAVSDRKASRRDCAITIANPATGQMMSSNYIWLDICKCFAAVHFTYAKKAAGALGKVSSPILASLRAGASERKEHDLKVAGGPSVTTKGEIEKPAVKNSSAVAEAIAILKQRGFPAPRVAQFVPHTYHGLVDIAFGQPKGTAQKQEFTVGVGDYEYDLETGTAIGAMSIKEFARNVSSCYRHDQYWKHCKLNYHQEMGCRMTKNWQRVCRTYKPSEEDWRIGDLCFWEPKGDIPMLPAKANAEKTVQLPKVAEVKPGAIGKKKQQKKASLPRRPYCDETPWPEHFGKQ
jgi:hypothetical protein